MIMRLFGLFLLLTTNWQSQISATSEDPEKYCPCLPPRLCPRIFGQSPVDSKQFGHLPDCKDLTTVRCCGASLTVITEHLGTTKYDEDYLRHGKSPVYIPAKINPVPIPENVMRQIKELGSTDEKQNSETKNEETSSSTFPIHEINHSVRNDIEDVSTSTTKSITIIEKTLTANDVTTPNPTTVNSTSLKIIANKCDGCDQSDISSTSSTTTDELTTTEKIMSINKNNEMEIASSQFSRNINNGTDENITNGKTNEQFESSTVMTGESSEPSSTTILSYLKLDVSATTDLVDIEREGKTDVNVSTNSRSDTVNDTKQTAGSSEPVAIINAQPYNVKTMRNLEMPREVYIILPNEETGRMVYENVTDNSQMNENKTNSSTDRSNEIDDADDDQIQNATNRQEIIEKHLDSIVFQNWDNGTESVATEKNVNAEEIVEDTSTGLPETTTETKNKRSQIRHNLYTRKPNSSILLQSRNKINEVPSTTTVSTTTKSDTVAVAVTKKDESVIRREEIERISNLTRDQLASGSEHVPVVVRKLPPPQFKESTRARAESKVEEDGSDVPPVRVPHFRHPPRVLKPVTTTKQPPVMKNERNTEGDGEVDEEEYDDGDVIEEGEETNNDEVFIDGEEGELVRTPQGQSRRRQQLIARSRGGSLLKKPAIEEDKSVDTSEEERVVAMHEFRKIRGQSKFRHPAIIESKQNTEPTLITRDVVTEGPKTFKSDRAIDKPITPLRARVRTSTRTETVTIPDITTVLPITTSTILPTTSPKSLNVDEENISTTQASLSYQGTGDTQDESLLETMEPRNSDTNHAKTQQVKPIELYEGKRLHPLIRNHNQEAHTGRRLAEKKNNFESVTDKNMNTEEKVVVPEVYTGRKVATTARKPIVVAPIQKSNSPILENIDKLKGTKPEDKPSITDEINDKETRQQNSGQQPVNRQRLRNHRLKVAPKTPQPSSNDETQTVNEQKEQTIAAPLSTESPPQQKSGNANFRGNFLRTRNRIGMIETIIQEQMLMEHAALKSRMLRNAVGSGKEAEKASENQHIIKDDVVKQSRGSHNTSDIQQVKDADGQKSTDQDLESEGSEQRLENRQVPIGFNPPARMERGFVPIVGQNLQSTSAFTEDGVPVKQLLLPEESKPPPSFNEVQPQAFQNSLKVVGPLPNGFHYGALRSTSAFTEDGIPVTQIQLPEELKPAQSFTEGQDHSQPQNRNLQSLPSPTVELVRVKQLELPTELIPPPSFTEKQDHQKHAEETRPETQLKDPIITKRTLTELVPPVLEAIFFRRTYDDTLVEYNQALMKYNDYINKFVQHQPLNSRAGEVKRG